MLLKESTNTPLRDSAEFGILRTIKRDKAVAECDPTARHKERKRKMGDRVHIVARSELKEIHEDGMRGFSNKTLYSAEQRDWFNNDKCQLADWFNEYADLDCWIDCGQEEWMIRQDELESIPEEAFKNPITGRTEEEMRRFIAECIRCAKLTGGGCHLEWW